MEKWIAQIRRPDGTEFFPCIHKGSITDAIAHFKVVIPAGYTLVEIQKEATWPVMIGETSGTINWRKPDGS